MDDCKCDYHHGLWTTCPYCTNRLEDDYFLAIVQLACLGADLSHFGHGPPVAQQIRWLCSLPADRHPHVRSVRELVLGTRLRR